MSTEVGQAQPGDRVALRLIPGDVVHELDPSWAKRVEATHQRLFCAPMDSLDADEGAARAFGAFVSDDPAEWTTALRLTRALQGLVSEPARCRPLGAAARQRALERYSDGPIAEAMVAMWRRVAR